MLQEDFFKLLETVTNKRAKIVIDHILKHGFITTEDLEVTYGYSHPPRAARDVREAGIPLETFSIKSKQGKSIAAYKFGDFEQVKQNKIAGRLTFSKAFKRQLFTACGGKCAICNGVFEERYLQIDHRIPYEISGDLADFMQKLFEYMLVCASCNRGKSWSCEHCENWITQKDAEKCKPCFWASPENYTHIALQDIRRLELIWQKEEVHFFDSLKKKSEEDSINMGELAKIILKKYIEQ